MATGVVVVRIQSRGSAVPSQCPSCKANWPMVGQSRGVAHKWEEQARWPVASGSQTAELTPSESNSRRSARSVPSPERWCSTLHRMFVVPEEYC